MPADYHIDIALSEVFSKAWGTLSDSDLLEQQRLIKNDPAFSPEFNQLFDFMEVTQVSLTSEGIQLLASRAVFGMGAKRAFVITPGAMAVFGMMRMFQILTDDYADELRVQFDHIDEARSWLGMPKQ